MTQPDFENAEVDELGDLPPAATSQSPFDTLPSSLLGQQAPSNARPPAATESYVQAVEAAAVKKLNQEHDQRKWLFRWAIGIVTVTLAANFGVFFLYMKSQWNDLSDAVMIAWISATVIEVLGIAYIIASHLFDKGTRDGRGRNSLPPPPTSRE